MAKRVLSLFSGCGGMDLGLEGDFEVSRESINPTVHPSWNCPSAFNKGNVRLPRTSFQTVFANDIRPGAEIVWKRFFSKRQQSVDNIFTLESIVELVKRSRSGEVVFPASIDVVTGGFPCQDFSVAGKRKGFQSHKSHHGDLIDGTEDASIENRGMLYYWMKEVIDMTRPKVFIAENVKGLISLENVKAIIEKDFSGIGKGYTVLPAKVLHAGQFGVPQSRERIIFIGFNNTELTQKACKVLTTNPDSFDFSPYPMPSHSLTPERAALFGDEKNLIPFVNVGTVLQGLKEPNESEDLSQRHYSKAKWYGRNCQGQIEVSLNKLGPTIRSEHHGNIEFRRLSKEHEGRNSDELEKGLQERRLTLRECARIQTFPDDFEFVIQNGKKHSVSASEGYKLVGNAVPPLLAYHLATRLESLWEKLFRLPKEKQERDEVVSFEEELPVQN